MGFLAPPGFAAMEWLRKVGQKGKDAAKSAALQVQDQLALPKDDDDLSLHEDSDEMLEPTDLRGPIAPPGRKDSMNLFVLEDVHDEEDANQKTDEPS